MNRIKLGALALTTALAITAGVTSLVAPQPAKAEAQSVNWSGRTRTLNIWPSEAPQAVGVGVVQVRRDLSRHHLSYVCRIGLEGHEPGPLRASCSPTLQPSLPEAGIVMLSPP